LLRARPAEHPVVLVQMRHQTLHPDRTFGAHFQRPVHAGRTVREEDRRVHPPTRRVLLPRHGFTFPGSVSTTISPSMYFRTSSAVLSPHSARTAAITLS